MVLKGNCLCRTVRDEVDQIDVPAVHCDFGTCRKAHAAAFATTAGVLRQHFGWTAAADKLSAYKSLPGKPRQFCSVCGTQLLAERTAQLHIMLRVLTLDDDAGQTPTLHIWTSHGVPWLLGRGEVPRDLTWEGGC